MPCPRPANPFRPTIPGLRAAPLLAAAALVSTLLATPAQAVPVDGTLGASASLATDPPGAVSLTSLGGQVTAAYPAGPSPAASATATRRSLDARVVASGGGNADQYSASAVGTTHYQLWSLTEQRALTGAEALGLRLSFDFNLSGSSSVVGSDHNRRLDYLARVVSGTTVNEAGDSAQITCGGACINLFSTSLLTAAVDIDFSLLHEDTAEGTLFMTLALLGAIAAELDYSLTLEGVHLAPSLPVPTFSAFSLPSQQADAPWSLADGLGVRFAETGDILTVVASSRTSSVPEPGALALLLAAAAAAGGSMRRGRRTLPAATPTSTAAVA